MRNQCSLKYMDQLDWSRDNNCGIYFQSSSGFRLGKQYCNIQRAQLWINPFYSEFILFQVWLDNKGTLWRREIHSGGNCLRPLLCVPEYLSNEIPTFLLAYTEVLQLESMRICHYSHECHRAPGRTHVVANYYVAQ